MFDFNQKLFEKVKYSPGYVYILQEREFIKTNESVYKIGKTKRNPDIRFKEYPKQSNMIDNFATNYCDTFEKIMIIVFKNMFIHRKDIGMEYFEGDLEEMHHIIKKINSELNQAGFKI